MKQSKRYWLFYLAVAVNAMLACVVFLSGHRCNRVYRVEMEFVCWHDAEVTNRLCEIESGARGYTGPSAAFVFEERLMMYSPTCVVNRVIARLRKDHPNVVCSDSEIRDALSSAEYFNSGIIVPHVHVIVRSGDANLSLSAAESFVDVVSDAIEEDAARTRSKTIEQIQNRLSRLLKERKLLVSTSRVTPNAQTELRRLDAAIEELRADMKHANDLDSDMELRVFRIRRIDTVREMSGETLKSEGMTE